MRSKTSGTLTTGGKENYFAYLWLVYKQREKNTTILDASEIGKKCAVVETLEAEVKEASTNAE